MKFKGVHIEVNRHGEAMVYYRANRGRRIRLPDDTDSDEFQEAVRFAATLGQMKPRPKREVKADIRRRDIGQALARGVTTARQRSKNRFVEFDLDLDWALVQVEKQDYRCALTAIPFNFEGNTFRRNPFAPSLDRIDCKRGYMKDNVRIVVLAVNLMLQDWGEPVLARVAMAYQAAKRRTSIPAPGTLAPAPKKIDGKINDLRG